MDDHVDRLEMGVFYCNGLERPLNCQLSMENHMERETSKDSMIQVSVPVS